MRRKGNKKKKRPSAFVIRDSIAMIPNMNFGWRVNVMHNPLEIVSAAKASIREALVQSLDLLPSPRLEIPDIQLIRMSQLATLRVHIQVTPTLLPREFLFPPMAAEILGIIASKVVPIQISPNNLTIWILMATRNIRLNTTEKLVVGDILASTAPMTQRMGLKGHVQSAATTSIELIHTQQLLLGVTQLPTVFPRMLHLDRVSSILTQITTIHHQICVPPTFLMDPRARDTQAPCILLLRVIRRSSLQGLRLLLGLLHLRYIHGAMF